MLRRFGLPVVLWVYGIALSVTLVSLWGRSVVLDDDLVAGAAAESVAAGALADRLEGWLADELDSQPGVSTSAASEVASSVLADPALEQPLQDMVEAVVLASADPDGGRVEVAPILAPAAPAVAEHMAAAGLPADEATVTGYIAGLDPLVLAAPGRTPLVGPDSAAARTLYIGTVVGLGMVALSGSVAVWLAEDRRAMLRSLLNRVAMSALGFFVMFWLGAWLLDPGAGRAPVRQAAARVIGANLWIPALIAAGAAGAGWQLRRRHLRPRSLAG